MHTTEKDQHTIHTLLCPTAGAFAALQEVRLCLSADRDHYIDTQCTCFYTVQYQNSIPISINYRLPSEAIALHDHRFISPTEDNYRTPTHPTLR